MTSLNSGYVTVYQNASLTPTGLTVRVRIPTGHVIMVSFKQLTWEREEVDITERRGRFRIWTSRELSSDFAQVYKEPQVWVKLYSQYVCKRGNCFELYYSFLPETSLRALSRGTWNVWNCSSGGLYPSMQRHLACNMKAECQDGRDESQHCPYSSVRCQGLVDLCGRCFSFDSPVNSDDDDNARVTSQKADHHCRSLGGQLGLPKCLHDWFGTLRGLKMFHEGRLERLWVGLSVNDMSLPAMYRHAVMEEEEEREGGAAAALYHSVHLAWSVPAGEKKCLATLLRDSALQPFICGSTKHRFGAVCEFKKNKSSENLKNPVFLAPSVKRFKIAVMSDDDTFVMVCSDGQATRDFLLCGDNSHKACGQQDHAHQTFPEQIKTCWLEVGEPARDVVVVPVPLFTCSDGLSTLSYTLVCDFIADCQDKSDESFCQHPACVGSSSVVCTTGENLYDKSLCQRCQNTEDAHSCTVNRMVSLRSTYFLSPALVIFDGVGRFVVTQMRLNESCPDTHFRCPGGEDDDDCLPVFTRCNGVVDCASGGHDEAGCEDVRCAVGLLRCRLSAVCVTADHVCDGWSHCPRHDDELACDVTCPWGCAACQGHVFVCPRVFSAALFPQLRWLDAAGSGMTLSDVSSNNAYLLHLGLERCSLVLLPPAVGLPNLRALILSHNRLRVVNASVFSAMPNLQMLALSHNPVSAVHGSAVMTALSHLDLSFTSMTVFVSSEVLYSFPKLRRLNLTFTSVHTIDSSGFGSSTPLLREVYMEGSPVETFPPDLFKDLDQLRVISADNYKLCCGEILPRHFDHKSCSAPRDEVSSCEDLLQSWSYRVFLWLITCLSLSGNLFCLCARLCVRTMASSSGAFSVFVSNLTMADFLMGVYSALVGGADEQFRGRYLHHDVQWRTSAACRVAGFLSLLSSEVSALIVWLITLDRFVVLRFPFSTLRFQRTSSSLACLLTWLAGWVLALLPLLPMTSHWEFYSQTGICIPLPVTRHQFRGREYSFSVLIVFNFVLFLLISAGQGFIYWSVQTNSLKTQSSKMSRDMTIARRLITVALTDFLCWFPIGLCGMLAEAGVAIPGEINVALAVFVLPLNSAVNPFVYTFNTLQEKRRKAQEAQFLSWLEAHSDVLGS